MKARRVHLMAGQQPVLPEQGHGRTQVLPVGGVVVRACFEGEVGDLGEGVIECVGVIIIIIIIIITTTTTITIITTIMASPFVLPKT